MTNEELDKPLIVPNSELEVLALCTEPGYGEHGTNYQVDCAFCWDAMEVNSRKLAALAGPAERSIYCHFFHETGICGIVDKKHDDLEIGHGFIRWPVADAPAAEPVCDEREVSMTRDTPCKPGDYKRLCFQHGGEFHPASGGGV